MIIKKDINIDYVEEIITELQSGKVDSIRIPHSIKFKGLGVEVALVQAIATWARKHPEGELHSYLNQIGTDKHIKFVTSLLGLIAASLTPRISLESHDDVKRIDFLAPASKMVTDMDLGNFTSLRRGAEVKLVSISGSRHRFLRSVCSASRAVKKPTYLVTTVREALKIILPVSGDGKNINTIIESFVPAISWMVFELFQNVFDHAEKDENGVLYSRPVGALKLAIQKFKTFEEASRMIPSSNSKYLTSMFKDSDNIRILEVSVMDNGAGLARKWTGLPFSEMTLEEEREAVIACLTKGKSSKNKDGHGYGLNNVLEKLKELNGYLRIRTGRLSIVKTFDNQTPVEVGSSDFSEELKPVEGMLISLLIPIKKEN